MRGPSGTGWRDLFWATSPNAGTGRGRPPFALIILLLAVLTGPAARAELKPGDAFPSLATAGLTGGPLPETAGHVTIVDFWASWCAPCKASFPAYARIQADYAARGLVVVAVSVDDRIIDYDGFLKKWHPTFVTLLDQQKRLVSTVRVPTMPTSYVLGRDGRVRFVHEGFHGSATEKELRSQIEALLAERN
jgi:thiol-disulfide isomerase/thioredoxin